MSPEQYYAIRAMPMYFVVRVMSGTRGQRGYIINLLIARYQAIISIATPVSRSRELTF